MGWEAQNHNSYIKFGGGLSQYCLAEPQRDILINQDHWQIEDGGKVYVPVDEMQDVTACEQYILPELEYGTYYTGPGATGTQLQPGDVITQTTHLHLCR